MKRSRALSVLIGLGILFFGGFPLFALEIGVYGNCSPTALPTFEAVLLRVDLGGHSLSLEEWEEYLSSGENLLLPAKNDVEQNTPFLHKRKREVVVSDFYGMEEPPYLPFFTWTENYHTVLFFNFLDESRSIPWEDLLQAIRDQNPDFLFVVGTSPYMPLLREKFASLSIATQFIERDTLPQNYSEIVSLPEKPVLLFFYSSRCPSCRKLKNEVTPSVFERYKDRIKVVYLDYTITAHYEELIRLEEEWKITETASVEIFSPAGYVVAEDEATVNEKLEELIEKTLQLEEDKKKVVVSPKGAKAIVTERFRKFTPWVVIGAGLLDGLNPCAFATIVFMVNLLLVLGNTRRRIFEIGVTYAAAVFVTYFLLGVGIFEIWRTLAVYQIVSRVVYGVMAGILFLLAALSLKDALFYRREGRETEMTLGLPKGWRVKINQYLKCCFTNKSFFLAAILSGFVISIVEAGCTGQVYLPTIMYIAKEVEEYRLRAFGYLLFYNAFFIIPLLIVFLGIFFGSQSKALVSFGRKNVFVSKIALAGLFVVLALLLLRGVLA